MLVLSEQLSFFSYLMKKPFTIFIMLILIQQAHYSSVSIQYQLSCLQSIASQKSILYSTSLESGLISLYLINQSQFIEPYLYQSRLSYLCDGSQRSKTEQEYYYQVWPGHFEMFLFASATFELFKQLNLHLLHEIYSCFM